MLFSLLESENVCLLKKNDIHDFVPQHCIGYEDEAWFYLHMICTENRAYVRQKDIDEARYPEMIINMARNAEFIARADVVNLLHVNEDKAYTLLKSLTKQGILSLVNKGKYAKYRLNGK